MQIAAAMTVCRTAVVKEEVKASGFFIAHCYAVPDRKMAAGEAIHLAPRRPASTRMTNRRPGCFEVESMVRPTNPAMFRSGGRASVK